MFQGAMVSEIRVKSSKIEIEVRMKTFFEKKVNYAVEISETCKKAINVQLLQVWKHIGCFGQFLEFQNKG